MTDTRLADDGQEMQAEFLRILRAHLSDIRGLAGFYAREGVDGLAMVEALEEAALELVGLAHGFPSASASSS